MKSYVRWTFFVVLIISLVSFVDKDKPSEGLMLGDAAPNFTIPATSHQDSSITKLSDLKGKYVLLSFWATYDAPSRLQNVNLNNTIQLDDCPVELVSVSFDQYQSIFKETVRQDGIDASVCFADLNGEKSKLYKEYDLKRGFTNFLLNENGVIIAKNVSSRELASMVN